MLATSSLKQPFGNQRPLRFTADSNNKENHISTVDTNNTENYSVQKEKILVPDFDVLIRVMMSFNQKLSAETANFKRMSKSEGYSRINNSKKINNSLQIPFECLISSTDEIDALLCAFQEEIHASKALLNQREGLQSQLDVQINDINLQNSKLEKTLRELKEFWKQNNFSHSNEETEESRKETKAKLERILSMLMEKRVRIKENLADLQSQKVQLSFKIDLKNKTSKDCDSSYSNMLKSYEEIVKILQRLKSEKQKNEIDKTEFEKSEKILQEKREILMTKLQEEDKEHQVLQERRKNIKEFPRDIHESSLRVLEGSIKTSKDRVNEKKLVLNQLKLKSNQLRLEKESFDSIIELEDKELSILHEERLSLNLQQKSLEDEIFNLEETFESLQIQIQRYDKDFPKIQAEEESLSKTQEFGAKELTKLNYMNREETAALLAHHQTKLDIMKAKSNVFREIIGELVGQTKRDYQNFSNLRMVAN
jgi:chromosome segregation ATPase